MTVPRAEMLAALATGETLAAVGARFGVSRQRIDQILRKETGQGIGYRERFHPCPTCGQPYSRRDDTAHRASPLHRAIRAARRVDRFWSRVVKGPGCWAWLGSHNPQNGYSQSHGFGEQYAHRVAYKLAVGPIPAGLTIDHLCRNHGCVNPDHLEAVTQRENTLRSPIAVAAINARKTHCPRGHAYDRVSADGRSRRCSLCSRKAVA